MHYDVSIDINKPAFIKIQLLSSSRRACKKYLPSVHNAAFVWVTIAVPMVRLHVPVVLLKEMSQVCLGEGRGMGGVLVLTKKGKKNRFEGIVKLSTETIKSLTSNAIIPALPENPDINSRLQSLDAMYSL